MLTNKDYCVKCGLQNVPEDYSGSKKICLACSVAESRIMIKNDVGILNNTNEHRIMVALEKIAEAQEQQAKLLTKFHDAIANLMN